MNNRITNNQKICQAFKNFLGIPLSCKKFCISSWVTISDDDIANAFVDKSELNYTLLRQAFIDFIIEKINESNYGASRIYNELYKACKQDAIINTFKLLSKQLDESEVDYFKIATNYKTDSKNDEMGYCKQCGGSITIYEFTYSSHCSKEILCSRCRFLVME